MTAKLARCLSRIDSFEKQISQLQSVRHYGKLTRVTGLVLEATGLQMPLGANCLIKRQQRQASDEISCEVVGFNGDKMLLMPYQDLEGIVPGAQVYQLSASDKQQNSGQQFPLGPALLGRVLDGFGQPLDSKPLPTIDTFSSLVTPPINPLQREPINHPLDVGVRAINSLLTVGRGQRMGLFAGSGVGKSILLGMMARYTQADVIVVRLIGERGREVKDFIENILGSEGLQRSVVIAAPADVSPLLRLQGATYATRIAEDFRDRGLQVLLIMDSLTRYAMAQREQDIAPLQSLLAKQGVSPSEALLPPIQANIAATSHTQAIENPALATGSITNNTTISLTSLMPNSTTLSHSISPTINSIALATPIDHPEWGEKFSEQILFLSHHGSQQAELRLYPEELGNLQIQLKVFDDKAQLSIVAANQQVRQVIETNLPQLRHALSEQGIELGQTHVGDQHNKQHSDENSQPFTSPSSIADDRQQQTKDDALVRFQPIMQTAITTGIDIFA